MNGSLAIKRNAEPLIIFLVHTLYEKYCVSEGGNLYAAFIDFRKAFDSVWHDGLFLKLRKIGLGGTYYEVLKNMYEKTTSSIKTIYDT